MAKKQELTLEEKQEKVRDFPPIDDAFFETLARNTKSDIKR